MQVRVHLTSCWRGMIGLIPQLGKIYKRVENKSQLFRLSFGYKCHKSSY